MGICNGKSVPVQRGLCAQLCPLQYLQNPIRSQVARRYSLVATKQIRLRSISSTCSDGTWKTTRSLRSPAGLGRQGQQTTNQSNPSVCSKQYLTTRAAAPQHGFPPVQHRGNLVYRQEKLITRPPIAPTTPISLPLDNGFARRPKSPPAPLFLGVK